MLFGKLFRISSINTKNFYLRILLSFILLTFIIVLSTSLIFSAMYLNSIYAQLTIDSINSVERLSIEFDNAFTQLRQTSINLKQFSDVYFFLISSNNDSYSINRADRYTRQVKNLNPLIHSIILYNKDFDFPIIAGRPGNDVKQFTNEKLVFPNIKSDLKMVYSSYSNAASSSNLNITHSISVVFTDNNGLSEVLDSALIMTLDRDEFENRLLRHFEGINFVCDGSGKIVFTSNKNFIKGDTISNESYFDDIVSSTAKNGSFKVKVDKDYKIATYIKSDVTGFYLINIKSLSNYTGIVKKKEATVIIISFIFLFVFMLVGYLLSKNIYSPIRKVTEMLTNSKYGKSDTQLGEIDMISKVFNETLDYIHNLEVKSEDRNSRLKENFLRRLLKFGLTAQSDEEEIKDYDFKIKFSNLIIVMIKFDNYKQIEGNVKLVYETTLCRTIPALIKKDFYCETVNMYEGEIGVILNFKNSNENNFETIVSSMDIVRKAAEESLHITLTIGIGGIASNISECSKEYNRAVEFAMNRFILGGDTIFYKKFIEERLQSSLYYPSEIEDKLNLAIKLNKIKDFSIYVDDLIELLKNYTYSEAVSALFQTAASCIKTINQIISQGSNRFYLSFDEFSLLFSEFQMIDQSKEWFMDIFKKYQKMLEEINRLKGNKHYNIVEKIQVHILNNFHDVNLSVESLAEMVDYTPYYFSRIFKEITGFNANDYIRQIRINKSKELLGMSDCKISEIPSMVGFTNITHFYSVFKKSVGLTPAAFREYKIQNSY